MLNCLSAKHLLVLNHLLRWMLTVYPNYMSRWHRLKTRSNIFCLYVSFYFCWYQELTRACSQLSKEQHTKEQSHPDLAHESSRPRVSVYLSFPGPPSMNRKNMFALCVIIDVVNKKDISTDPANVFGKRWEAVIFD